jgi:CDP-diacylglycerol--glycerol-3-phosphate 3-phosphatidyltransferase
MNLAISLTAVRIVLVPLIVVFLISSSRVHVLIAALIFVIAALTDWLDGLIARRRNQVTTLGTLLDPVADKLLVAAALISLVQIEMVPAWIAVVIIGREFVVTTLRSIVGIELPVSRLGKYKTVSQYVAITLLILEKGVPAEYVPFHWLSSAVLWIAMGLTLISGVDYLVFHRALRKTDDALVKEPDRWP